MGFIREAVEGIDENWTEIEFCNEILERLRKRRLPVVKKEGDAARSKVVWKIRAFQQSVLYRTVMLADGCADAWNAHNQLASILCARAIIETAAFFVAFETELLQLCEQGDFTAIDKLVMNRTFATRLKNLYGEVSDMNEAVNILTLIGKLDKKLGYKDNRVLSHYEFLSEFCHPNSFGHTQFFEVIDKETATINFSDKPLPKKSLFRFTFSGFMLIGLVEDSVNQIDSLLPKVRELSETDKGM